MVGRPIGSRTVRYRSALVRNADRTYSVSVQVPAELQSDIGARQLRYALDTKQLEEADFLQPFVAHDIARSLDRLWADKIIRELHQNERPDYLEIGKKPPSPAENSKKTILSNILDGCPTTHFIRYESLYRLEDLETRKLLRAVDCLVIDFRIPVRRYSREYWQLVGRIDRLRRQQTAELIRESKNEPDDANQASNGKRNATLFETAILFEGDFGHSWSPGTRENYERAFSLLLEFLGPETLVREVTRADLRRLRNVLEDLASNWRNRSELRHLPLEEAAKRSRALGLPRRSSKSIKDIFDNIKIMMDFAIAEGLIERNFAVGMHKGLPQHTAQPPYPFSLSQLQAIFHHPPFYDRVLPLEERHGLFWMPLLALWTGMRLSECCQLKIRDVEIIDGIPVIRVLPDRFPPADPATDKRLKTKHSVRVMPIHPVLQRVGFVDFWRHVQKTTGPRLFPQFRRTGHAQQFVRESKQLTAFVRSATNGDPLVTFHSFRHTFRDAARNCDLPKDRARILGGWGHKDISDQYGIGGSIARLYDDIQKIAYPGLDLSHLEL